MYSKIEKIWEFLIVKKKNGIYDISLYCILYHLSEHVEIEINKALLFKIVLLDHTNKRQINIDLAEEDHLPRPQCDHSR